MADLVGKQLGNYRLVRMLGHGGFGDVYLSRHIYLDKHAAIKVIHPYLTEWQEEAFRVEAQRLVDLEHPNIVRILDFGIEVDLSYLVMEYAPNGSLRERHPPGSQLPLDTIVFYVKHLADALQYVHKRKLIHRDIKPANVLLGSNYNLLLSDVGLAIVAHSERSFSPQQAGGTPSYMAPEQAEGKAVPASDQYSLGIMVYEWLCGKVPFSGGNYIEFYHKHKKEAPPSFKQKGVGVLPSVEAVVMIALAKEPKERFPTVQEFAIALEQASQEAPAPSTDENSISGSQISTQHSPPPAIPPLPPAPPQPIRRMNRLTIGLIALVVIVIGTSVLYAIPALMGASQPSTTNQAVGYFQFLSSPQAHPGTLNEVQIKFLHPLHPADSNTIYYAWLVAGPNILDSWQLTLQKDRMSSTPHLLQRVTNLRDVDFFLISLEVPGSVGSFPKPGLDYRPYYANISLTNTLFPLMTCPGSNINNPCTSRVT